MLKKISMILVLVLVVTTLSACAGSAPKLTEEKKAEIENAWYAQYKWRWQDDPDGGRCRYYGNYEGYDIIFNQMGDIFLDVIETKKIGGIEFNCGNPFNLYGYRNGKLYEVQELYEQGELSVESLAAAAEIHKSGSQAKHLSQQEKEAIERAWAVKHHSLLWDSKEEQKYTARYYSSIEGYDILYVVMRIPPDCLDHVEYTIGESKFVNNCSANIYGIKDGALAFIRDLYKEGKLSEDAIAEIAKIHQRFESKES